MRTYREDCVRHKAARDGIVELRPVGGKSATKRPYDWLVVSLDYPLTYWLSTPLQIERAQAKPARLKVLNECRTEEAAMNSRSRRYDHTRIYGRTFVVHRAIYEAHYKGRDIG